MKLRLFPAGPALFVWLFLMLALFAVFHRGTDAFLSDLSFAGLLVTLACPVHMWIEVFGDGKRDLIKHLFLPNVLFDISVILAVNVLVLWFLKLRRAVKTHA
jgi:hypothetical protein